ncbi:unnamed protein product [Leptidea sinapis]|uniref:Uncharacterized protein n=1 Tax=Leptidea sinapis TaxID=189913 RepID=A0A5E4R293_9NEOP|nr:unnamed protein product [Leptidea sinapis]
MSGELKNKGCTNNNIGQYKASRIPQRLSAGRRTTLKSKPCGYNDDNTIKNKNDNTTASIPRYFTRNTSQPRSVE